MKSATILILNVRLNSMHPDNEKVLRETEKLLGLIKKYHDQIKKTVPDNDIRVSVFGLTGNVLHSLLLFFAATIQTIAEPKWWKQTYGKEQLSDQDMGAIRNIERLSKHSFFVFFFSRIETVTRKTINLVHPGFDTTGVKPFKQIYDKYLRDINQDNFIPLFDICRLIRNSIHSNGVYISKNGNNQTINWNGKDYVFKHRSAIDFMSADEIFYLYEELIEAINSIVNSNFFQAHNFVEDKYH